MSRKLLTGLLATAVLLPACVRQEQGTVIGGDSRPVAAPAPTLESWRDGAAKERLLAFIEASSDPASEGFVPEAERVAVFDNDGTLWSEQPAYFQAFFAMDRIRELAPEHPEWADDELMAAAVAGDLAGVAAHGVEGLLKVVSASHAGMTAEEFSDLVVAWMAEARHPVTGRAYTDMVYQPMLELLALLRAHGWRTWIVSGGGVAFMRPWTAEVYGIPPEQVVGSRIRTVFEDGEQGPVIRRLPEIAFIDDKEGKPVGIREHIGLRPRFVFGNSDGDLQMIQYVMAGEGPRFAGIVHHTDAEREVAYDRESHIGQLDKAMDAAKAEGWLLVDMAADWAVVYPPE